MSEIVIQQLSPILLDDWLDYFDHDAFADNPEWSGCFCRWFHFDHEKRDFASTTAEENRTASADLIRTGRLKGYLAYAEGRPIGWCQAAPRLEIPNIAKDPDLAVDDAAEVGSIVCFNVAASLRRQGVATGLLEAACAGFQKEGLKSAEAYPRKAAEGDAANYHGPRALYVRAGFETYREVDSLLMVRRRLGPTTSERGGSSGGA